MNESSDINSDLLAGYLAGEADVAQRAAVEAWAASDAANAQELARMRRLWDISDSPAAPDVDVNAAWTKLEARIAQAEGRGRLIPLRRARWQRWAAAAAIVAVALTVRWLWTSDVQRFAATTDPVPIALDDGSAITLLPGSDLEARMGDERATELHGTAYFEVKRDEARPFTVDAGEVLVTVLGTAFEVSAHDTASTIQVRVRSGRVRVQAGADTVVLVAGQHARYDRKRHFLERRAAPPAEVWGNRILQFEGAPLDQVMAQLERIYHVQVRLLNPTLTRCTLTAEFDDEPVERILRVIADTFGLELQQEEDGSYTLDGDGC